MLLGMLIAASIGALIGVAVIGVCECLKMAANYFSTCPSVTKVKTIKKGCSQFNSVVRSNAKIRAAVNGETTGITLIYENGKLTRYEALDKEFSEDFDDCSGYCVYRNKQDMAYAIR